MANGLDAPQARSRKIRCSLMAAPGARGADFLMKKAIPPGTAHGWGAMPRSRVASPVRLQATARIALWQVVNLMLQPRASGADLRNRLCRSPRAAARPIRRSTL